MDILVDVDDTLSDTRWRSHLIKEHGWDAFYGAAGADTPIRPIVDLVKIIGAHHPIIINTSRPEKWRSLTMTWLMKHGIDAIDVIMRKPSDFRKAPEVKFENAMAYYDTVIDYSKPLEPKRDQLAERVGLVIDDNLGVIQKFRGIGITCLLVNPDMR